jgi:hypothetical protein
VVGSSYHGVAKGATLESIKVAGRPGELLVSRTIAGLDYIRGLKANSAFYGNRPVVVNMSFTYPFQPDLNAAVTALYDAGIFAVASAGNSNDK